MTRYEPEAAPINDDERDLKAFIERELRRVASAFDVGVDTILLTELHNEPERPRAGMIVLADGTNWNPGSGAGFYGYRSGAWQFLG